MKMSKKILLILLVVGLFISVVALCGCEEKTSYGYDTDKGIYEKKSYSVPGFELPILMGALVGFIIYKKTRNST